MKIIYFVFSVLKFLKIIKALPCFLFKKDCIVYFDYNYKNEYAKAKFISFGEKENGFQNINIELLQELNYTSTHGSGGTLNKNEIVNWYSTADIKWIKYSKHIDNITVTIGRVEVKGVTDIKY